MMESFSKAGILHVVRQRGPCKGIAILDHAVQSGHRWFEPLICEFDHALIFFDFSFGPPWLLFLSKWKFKASEFDKAVCGSDRFVEIPNVSKL